MPPNLAQLRSAIGLANDILSIAVGLENVLGDVSASSAAILNNIESVQGSLAGLSDQLGNSTGGTAATLASLSDRISGVESKVSTIKRILTTQTGFSTDDEEWPVLDLRPTPDNIPRWFPATSRLIDWLNYAALATVPTTDAGTTLLQHIDAPAIIIIGNARAIITHVTVEPAGTGGTALTAASIVETLGYFSWRALGAFTAPEKINHRDQLWIPRGFVPTAVAIEPRPGVELDVLAVIPTLKLQ